MLRGSAPNNIANRSISDNRVLLVRDGATAREYKVSELVTAIGLTELQVSKDPRLEPDRVYVGFALRPLLKHVGLCAARELQQVCADGYRIPFDLSTQSKMPPLSKSLSPAENDQVTACLRAMQPAK